MRPSLDPSWWCFFELLEDLGLSWVDAISPEVDRCALLWTRQGSLVALGPPERAGRPFFYMSGRAGSTRAQRGWGEARGMRIGARARVGRMDLSRLVGMGQGERGASGSDRFEALVGRLRAQVEVAGSLIVSGGPGVAEAVGAELALYDRLCLQGRRIARHDPARVMWEIEVLAAALWIQDRCGASGRPAWELGEVGGFGTDEGTQYRVRVEGPGAVNVWRCGVGQRPEDLGVVEIEPQKIAVGAPLVLCRRSRSGEHEIVACTRRIVEVRSRPGG